MNLFSSSPHSLNVFTFTEGQLHVYLLPTQENLRGATQEFRIRIHAINLPLNRYQVSEAWVEEVYELEQVARHRLFAFSGADAEYWMDTLLLLYMQPLQDEKK